MIRKGYLRAYLGIGSVLGLLGLAGLVAGLWHGLGPDLLLLLGLCLLVLLMFLALVAYGLHSNPGAAPPEPAGSGAVTALLSVIWLLVPVAAAAMAVQVWREIRGPYGFQYRADFGWVRHVAPDRSFELRHPSDWKVLTPAEAAALPGRSLLPTAALRLVIGNPDDWRQNINIQLSPAPSRDGKAVRVDKDLLLGLAKQLRTQVRQADPTARVVDDGVEEVDGRLSLTSIMSREVQGQRLRQSGTVFVANDQLVTITATAPEPIFRGLNRHRFEKIVESFRAPAAAP